MKKNLIYCAIAMVASVFTACNKESFTEPVQGEGRVFTASFADTKATSATGVVTFKAGETIDLWYMDGETAKSETITLTAENITNAGKSVVFNSTITADKIMAVYPGYVSGSNKGNNWQTAPATASLPGAKGPRFNLTSATEGVSSGFVTGGSTSFSLKNQLAIISFSADQTMSGFAYLYDNRQLADANAKNIYIQTIINWETGEAVGVNPQGYVATNKLTDKDDMRFVVVPTFSLPEGFTIKAGSSLSTATEVVKTEKAFTANTNQFLKIGNINRRNGIDIKVSNITYGSADVSYTPSKSMTYFADMARKSVLDKYSDDEFIEVVLEQMASTAASYGVTLPVLLGIISKDSAYSDTFDKLPPETAMAAYAFGVDVATATATTGLFKAEFTTLEDPNPFNIELELKELEHNYALVSTTVSNQGVHYMFSIESAGYYNQFETAQELADADIEYFKKKYGSTYAEYGFASVEDLIYDGICSVGDDEMDDDNIKPSSSYVAYAYALNENLELISDVFALSFTSPDKPTTGLEFYGTAIWHDVFVSSIFKMEGRVLDMPCDVYTDATKPGIFYFDSPYWYNNIYSWFKDMTPEEMKRYTGNYRESSIEIDCSNPAKCEMEIQDLGINMNSTYGWISGGFGYGYQVDSYGTYADNVITFSAKGRTVLWAMSKYDGGETYGSPMAEDFTVTITPGGSPIKPASVKESALSTSSSEARIININMCPNAFAKAATVGKSEKAKVAVPSRKSYSTFTASLEK